MYIQKENRTKKFDLEFVSVLQGSPLRDSSLFGSSEHKHEIEVTETKRVGVILGFYNGMPFIKDQLNSIFNQTQRAVKVFVCDDHSSQKFTVESLDLKWQQQLSIKVGYRSKNIGFAKNFLSALSSVGNFDYYAFSDQDDIWYERKLETAIFELEKCSSDTPSLYCARTEITDSACDKTLGYSTLFNKPPSFANALVQSIGGGNTMVFNRAAKEMLVKAGPDISIVSHDWWCYQLITGIGGTVIYDTKPCLKYRQHANNLTGSSISLRAQLKRLILLMQGRFSSWNDINIIALHKNKHLLTTANQRVLSDFSEARNSWLLKRIILFKRSGVHRQTFLGNIGLFFGILLGKV